MKVYAIICISILLFSCNKQESKLNVTEDDLEHEHHKEIHKEMNKVMMNIIDSQTS